MLGFYYCTCVCMCVCLCVYVCMYVCDGARISHVHVHSCTANTVSNHTRRVAQDWSEGNIVPTKQVNTAPASVSLSITAMATAAATTTACMAAGASAMTTAAAAAALSSPALASGIAAETVEALMMEDTYVDEAEEHSQTDITTSLDKILDNIKQVFGGTAYTKSKTGTTTEHIIKHLQAMAAKERERATKAAKKPTSNTHTTQNKMPTAESLETMRLGGSQVPTGATADPDRSGTYDSADGKAGLVKHPTVQDAKLTRVGTQAAPAGATREPTRDDNGGPREGVQNELHGSRTRTPHTHTRIHAYIHHIHTWHAHTSRTTHAYTHTSHTRIHRIHLLVNIVDVAVITFLQML